MSKPVISVEHLSKTYRLGQIGTGTLTNDLKVWFAKKTGKPNPLLKIGQTDHGNMDGETLWALRDVSFQVEQGEVLGIIGRNGAGKSTLLKILSRVTAPSSGCIKVKGRIASLLEVGTGFHPDLTGRENIYLNGAILGMTKQEIARKFDEIVDFAEVEKFIDTPVKRYSSGMYVRLAFAVAAHLESEILLVDEVLAVGDAEFQKKCLGKMGDVASKEGRTVLFVSHNMAAVKMLCNKGILISNGEVKTNSDIDSVVNHYQEISNLNISSTLRWEWDNNLKKDNICRNVLITAEDDRGNKLLQIKTYDLVRFRITTLLDEDVTDGGIEVAFDTEGVRLLKLTTKPFGNFPVTFKKGKPRTILLTIPNFPLASGYYDISVGVSRPLKGFLTDGMIRIGSLLVEDAILFGGNRPLVKKQSLIACEHQWSNDNLWEKAIY